MENDERSLDTITESHCIDRGYIHESNTLSHLASPCSGYDKLEVYDWMNDIEHTQTRKTSIYRGKNSSKQSIPFK